MALNVDQSGSTSWKDDLHKFRANKEGDTEGIHAQILELEGNLEAYKNEVPVHGYPTESNAGYVPGDKEQYIKILEEKIKKLQDSLSGNSKAALVQ